MTRGKQTRVLSCPALPPWAPLAHSPLPLTPPNVHRCECGTSFPSFGMPGEKCRDARWCAKCPTKDPAAVNVALKMCHCGQSRPSYGLPMESARDVRWCANCPDKPSSAVLLVHRLCECGRAMPCFGPSGGNRNSAKWCVQCPSKPADAVNLLMKKCVAKRNLPYPSLSSFTGREIKIGRQRGIRYVERGGGGEGHGQPGWWFLRPPCSILCNCFLPPPPPPPPPQV